jgi:hypothetical protein
MKKFIKILLSILFVLIVTIIAVPYFLKDDIEKFIKDEINNSVNAKIDYDDVSLSLLTDFPNLHLKIKNISIDGVQEFKNVRLAQIDLLTMSLNAKRLFFEKDLEIKKIGLSGADFIIKVLKNGKANYDIVKPDSLSNQKPADKQQFTIKIQAYNIDNSNLIYDDNSLDMHLKIKNLNHNGNGVFTDNSYQLNTQTQMDNLDFIFDHIHYINNAKSKIDAHILIENDFSKYTMKDVLLSLNDLDITSDMMFELKDDDINMDITYATRENSLKKLLSLIPKAYMPDIKGLKTEGVASLKGFVKGTYNEKNYPAYGLDFVVNNGKIQYPDLPQAVTNINLKTKIDFPGGSNLNRTAIDMSRIHFTVAGNSADGHLSISNPVEDPYINTAFKSKMDMSQIKKAVYLPGIKKLSGLLDADFSLKGRISAIEKQQFDKFDASGYFNLKNMNYASDSLSYEVNISQAEMSINPQALQLTKFDAKVGESDFHINGNIENYIGYFLKKDKVLKAGFHLHSNYLNLNEFMTEDNQTGNTTETKNGGIIKIPANLDLTFIADADKMKYQNLDLQNAKGKVTIKDKKAGLETVLLKTLGGDMTLKGIYDTSNEVVQSAMNLSMKKLSLSQSAENLTMFSTYTPVMKKLQGRFFSDMDIKVNLDHQMNPILETLDASGLFKTGNLKIDGIDIVKKIGNMLKINELKQAKVDDISAKFEIKKGKLFVKPFNFKINQIKSGLQGNVSLDQKINFELNMDIPRKMLGNKANDILEGLVGKLDKLGLNADLGNIIKMKFKITGDMNNPKIVPVIAGTEGNSMQEVITNAVEQKVDEAIDQAKAKAQEEARKKADALLAQAQKQANLIKSEAGKTADKIRLEAQKQADELIKKAGNDPFKKLAAKTLAKKLKKEAEKKANKLEIEAQKKADLIMKNAREKADKLINNIDKPKSE